MSILPDSLDHNLQLIFCGTAASNISARDGAYYANPTNYFWRTLHEIGLTPRLYQPQEFPKLLKLGIGFTDMAKHAQGNDNVLSNDDFDRDRFLQKIREYRPKYIAFTSKKAASVALDCKTSDIDYGLQPTTMESTKIWILTSPSGSARRYWDISVWQTLAHAIHQHTHN